MRIVENYRITRQAAGRTIRTTAPYALLRADGSLVLTSSDRRDVERAMARNSAPAPTADAQAVRVAGMLGLSAPAATGQCHYCGGNLDRYGRCDECR